MPHHEQTPTLNGLGPLKKTQELRPGTNIGRYTVLQSIGQGGMGIVYAAYDPRLDRKVALKLLRRRSEDKALEARLLREAQALAKLNDPHVLTLYDVGTFGERIFLAMEYVEGQDLSRWLKAGERSETEVLETFIQAGRGLAAAHRAGLVHRDFKPNNVMIRSDDGRALVLDFGLARSSESPPEETDASNDDAPTSDVRGPSPKLSAALTRAGSILGTPAFMAPEQWEGREAGQAADQFSFCAALYSALCGEPPFTPPAPGSKPTDWTVQTTERRELSARLRRVLLRGLQQDPEQRYPSMEALLRELSFEPKRQRFLTWAAVAAFGALALGVALWPRTRPCYAAGQLISEAWNLNKYRQIQSAFASTERPYVDRTLRAVGQILDRYSEQWRETYVDACEATHLRGDQSPQLLDRRNACLDQRRRELQTLVDLFIDEPLETVEGAVDAADSLSPLAPCSDSAALMSPLAPPSHAEERARIADLRDRLAQNRAVVAAGQYEAGAMQAKDLARKADSEQYLPVVAETLVHLGRVQVEQAQYEEAHGTLKRALEFSLASNHDRPAAEAFVHLVRLLGFLEGDFEQGDHYARLAASAIARLDRGTDLEARLADHIGTLELQRGNPKLSAQQHRKALALKRRILGNEHPSVARTLIRMSRVAQKQRNLDLARSYLLDALAIQKLRLGPHHPLVATTIEGLGNTEFLAGRFEAAEKQYRRALAILLEVFGEVHPRVASAKVHLGNALSRLDRTDEAFGLYQQAFEIYTVTDGPEHYNVALFWHNIGSTYEDIKDYESALEAFSKALVILEKTFGPNHTWVATTVFNMGETHNELGENHREPGDEANRLRQFKRAEELHRRALRVWQDEDSGDPYLAGHGLTGLGRSYVGQGRHSEAAHLLRQALALWQGQEQDSAHPAYTHWMLARATAESDPAAAENSARRAIEEFQASEGEHEELVQKIQAWLDKHGGSDLKGGGVDS